MIDYAPLYRALAGTPAARWLDSLPEKVERAFQRNAHGDLPRWREVIERLPRVRASRIDLNADSVTIGAAGDVDTALCGRIDALLRELHPWRKGPYTVHGIHIDTEWRSDWKWNRLRRHIASLENRLVLDVGCGNGYHGWRMAGEGARLVVGIDPILLSVMQFHAIRRFAGDFPVYVLPLCIEEVPPGLHAFDTVFSMGVFHHRRSPMDHLYELRGCLRPGGELVLETLVIEGGPGQLLVPEHRYAKMRNVWFIPSCETLMGWLKRCGYHNIRLIDVSKTTTDEQRSTGWMRFQSLADFLDPENPDLTCEGYPAPRRAVFIADSP